MKDRPSDDYWYRFKIGDRVEGIPESASLGGRRGTVLGYSEKAGATCVVRFDDTPDHPAHEVVGLLRPLGVVDKLGELV